MDEYTEALEAENRALKKEVDFIKQIRGLVLRMVEARADREKCAAVRKVIALDRENRAMKKQLKERQSTFDKLVAEGEGRN